MTRDDALLEAAFVQGEPHVGTTVVECKHFPLVQAKQQWAIFASHYHHSPFLQFGEGRCGKKIGGMSVFGIHSLDRSQISNDLRAIQALAGSRGQLLPNSESALIIELVPMQSSLAECRNHDGTTGRSVGAGSSFRPKSAARFIFALWISKYRLLYG